MNCIECDALLLDGEIEKSQEEGIMPLCYDCFDELEEDELKLLKGEK